MGRLRKRAAGFTMLEMMMVVSVISLLSVLLMPTVAASRAKTIDLKCKSNQRVIWEAVNRYEFDFNTTLFTIRNNGVRIRNTLVSQTYVRNPITFECPASQVIDNDDILLTYIPNTVDFANTRCTILPVKHLLQ